MRPTKRDLQLFKGLYYYRCLSAKQIRSAYFNGAQSTYRRLTKLQENGYLESRPVVEGTRKTTQAYWLTQKAIDLLDIPNKRHASKNQPHSKAKYEAEEDIMIKRLIQLNSVPVSVITSSPDNWTWVESRELKAKYENINRNSPLAGLLETKHNERYGIFFTIPADLTAIENYSQAIITELNHQKRNLSLNMVPLVIAHNPEILRHYRALFGEQRNQMRTSSFTRLIPFGDKTMTAISRLLADYNNQIAKVIERLTGESAESITRSTQAHATHESKTAQYAEIITFPVFTLSLLAKYIGLNTATPVNLIAWTGQRTEIASVIPNYDTHRNLKIYWLDILTDPLAKGDTAKAISKIALPEPVSAAAPPGAKERVSFTFPKDYVEYLKNTDIKNRSQHISDILTSHDDGYRNYLKLKRKEEAAQ